MPKRRKKEKVQERHFTWLLGRRDGVWYADGRSNQPPAGRHSLGTTDHEEALVAVKRLDLVQAVKAGLADASELEEQPTTLELSDGWELYRKHVSRPRVTGGARPVSVKRYRAVFDKFIPFAQAEGIRTWNRVTTQVLEGYAAWLDDEGYAYRTEYLELTTLKQAVNWLKEAGHLPASVLVKLSLTKPDGTDTYCWKAEEVRAIVNHCRADTALNWLGHVVAALATTGLRISELAALRWSDVDQAANVIHLSDESARAPRKASGQRRQTKGGRGRSFPISAELRDVLQRMTPGEGAIFHGPRGGALKPDTVRTILIRDVLAALAKQFPSAEGELGFKDGRLHSFRHYFCSTCANGGVPEAVVMKWLGHRHSEMVRHYYHLHDAEAQRQMQRVTFLGEAGDTGSSAH